MSDTIVRLESIKIENFKNVIQGQIHFRNTRKNYQSSILGLFGQNGSGKTALIDALELLQYALKGQPVPPKFADYINVDTDTAKIQYEFSVQNKECVYLACYELKLRAVQAEELQNYLENHSAPDERRTQICEEVLSYSYEADGRKIRKSVLIDTSASEVFSPASKYRCLLGKAKSGQIDLMIAKKLAAAMSRSFLFSRELLSAIRKNGNASGAEDPEYQRHMLLLESLVRYGNYELFVINTANSGMISLNALPLSFWYANGLNRTVGNLLIPLDDHTPVPEEAVDVVNEVIEHMNKVLTQMVPGLTIRVEVLGETLFENGEKGKVIQLVSLKNKKAIPLKYESEGIKKIISILQLLIVVYTRPSITVAIDELDSGVFEYLLGELLRIISEKGKGQLIFTLHNLRPLETLDRGFLAFTTTNPSNRYVRLNNIKENNNVRDVYYRDILLGGQNELLYEPTNNAEIAFAFREAGEVSAT